MVTGKQKTKDTAITYQNKDVVSKIFGENLKEKSFAVYGIKLPKIMEVLPTNLPVIEANELRIDNLFLLEDGSLALVDYESDYADANKIKYLNYIVRTLKRTLECHQQYRKIRMVVIYTADIKSEQTSARFDAGCLQFQLEEAFLSSLNADAIEKKIAEKIQKKEKLTSEEQMQLVILPLAYDAKEQKQGCVKRCFELVKDIEDEEVQKFLVSGILVFADKIVTEDEADKMKGLIMMTKVAQLFEEEKQEAVKEAERKEKVKMVKKLLEKGMSVDDILEVAEGLTREEIIVLEQEKEQR